MASTNHSLDGSSGTIMNGVNAVYIHVADENLIEIFPTGYSERHSCKFTSSPVESGKDIVDGKFKLPTLVNFRGTVKKAAFQDIQTIIDAIETNKKKICKFYGKSGSVSNMLIESLDIIGVQQKLDAVEISVSLKELLEV